MNATQTLDRPKTAADSVAYSALPRSFWERRLPHYCAAFAILFGLWYFDRLRFDQFSQTDLDWRWILAAWSLFLPNYLIAALRIRCILHGMNVSCSFVQAISYTFSGVIGELTIPIMIGGDLVKAIYVGQTSNRSTAVASVLADRFIGLLGLFVFALLVSLVQMRLTMSDERLFKTMAVSGVLAAICLMSCILVVFLMGSANQCTRRTLEYLPIGDKILTMLRALKKLCTGQHFCIAMLFSILGHSMWVMSVICLAYALHLNPPLVPTLLILPIVILCNTLSFAGGIGGGLLAFEYLFHEVLGAAPGDGTQLGIAVPILLMLSKIYAIPWFFAISWKGR